MIKSKKLFLGLIAIGLVFSSCTKTHKPSSVDNASSSGNVTTSSVDNSSSNSNSSINESSSSSSSSTNQTSSSSSGEINYRPEFVNVEDISISQGEYFNPAKNVRCLDYYGSDITSKMEIESDVDYSTPGNYQVVYSVVNSKNELFTYTRNVKVIENDQFDKEDEVKVYSSSSLYVISRGANTFGKYKDHQETTYLTDGDLTTRYESLWEETTSEVVIDLGADLAFEKIKLVFENASSKSYQILASKDNISYQKIYNFTNGASGARTDEIDVKHSARYIKFIFSNKTFENYGYSLYEIEVYGYRGLCVPYQEYPDLFTSKAIIDEQYLRIDFAKKISFDQVQVNFCDYLSPSSYDLYSISSNQMILIKENLSSNNIRFDQIESEGLYLKFHSRPFNSKSYRISSIDIRLNDNNLNYQGEFSSSSYQVGHEASNARSNYAIYWSSECHSQDQILDIGSIEKIGTIDLKWNQNFGKIYDILISSDNLSYELVYRQKHGSTRVQSIDLYKTCRYIKIVDYSNPNEHRFQLENAVVHSPYNQMDSIDYQIGELNLERVKHQQGKGSYVSNDLSFVSARYVEYIDPSLRSDPIPSNDWWQSLLINNYGHAMYLNPLRVKYHKNGLGIALPGKGYFETTYNRSQTVTEADDIILGIEANEKKTQTEVINYSDIGVEVSFSDKNYDKMVNSFYQGSPFVYASFTKDAKPFISGENLVIYDLEMNQIKETNGTFSQLIVEVDRFETYENNTSGNNNQKVYEKRYYLISSLSGSTYNLKENKLDLNLSSEYLSIGALPSLDLIDEYSKGGYYQILNSLVDYSYDEKTNQVTTDFNYLGRKINSSSEAIITLLPHQHKKANITSIGEYQTIRGTMKIIKGSSFRTTDIFYGIMPQFSEPNDETYSREVLEGYLNKYDQATNGNIMSEDAYWQGKSLHPLANAILICDQIGNHKLKEKFIVKLKSILVDWFTYSGEDDKYYFVFDDEWSTLYYRVSEFGANFNLADHHFTYGYFSFASAILASFDSKFLSDYQMMIDLLINDYMNYDKNNNQFCMFRNYDYYAGHSWAGGYSDSDGGNNQESAGEALNSWVGAYLFSVVSNNTKLRDAAIFGYVTELNAVKEYWFDYDKTNFDIYPYSGLGQIYGGSNFYGTFFNGDPTYIYGIQWLPGGEFLSSYAIGEKEQARLWEIYQDYLTEEESWTGHPGEDGYQHILWVILAIANQNEALNRLENRIDEISNNNECFNVYYMIHALKSLKNKTDELTVQTECAFSAYKNQDGYKVLVWNPTNQDKEVTINLDGQVYSYQVNQHSLVKIDLGQANKNQDIAELNQKYTLDQAFYKNGQMYGYRYYTQEDVKMNLHVINTSNMDLQIEVYDRKNNLIGKINCMKDDNTVVSFELQNMIKNQEVYIKIPDEIVVVSVQFASI